MEPEAASQADNLVMDYSNEDCMYHCRYEDLSNAHDQDRHGCCRQGFLDLLTEPNLPRETRVQSIQMVATLVGPAMAAGFLEEADGVLAQMDQCSETTRLLKEDNEKMQKDMAQWLARKEDDDGREDGGAVDGDGEVGIDLQTDATASLMGSKTVRAMADADEDGAKEKDEQQRGR